MFSLINSTFCYFVLAWLTWYTYKVFYNIFLSPLKDIPGPLILQVFPYYKLISRIQGLEHSEETRYHTIYGPTVRIGWNRVIFASPEAATEIYSTHAFKKGPFYKMFSSFGTTVFNTNDRVFHQKRKRIIAPAFSQKQIDSLDESIQKAGVEPIVEILDQHAINGSMADLYILFGSLTLDVIGEVSFGKTFNTIKSGSHPIMEWFSQSQYFTAFYLIFPFLRKLGSPPSRKIRSFGLRAVENVKKAPHSNSIMRSLMDFEDPETGDKLDDDELISEAILQIIGGSDSTSNTMTWTFYLVLKHHEVHQKLVEELLEAFPQNGSLPTLSDITEAKLSFMEAVIKESMRLIPAAQRAFERIVPEGGRRIHGHFIPEGTLVGANILALHTLPALWGNDASEFKPERWMSEQTDLEEEGR